MLFPNAPSDMSEILEFCLASLIYHEKWLWENMPGVAASDVCLRTLPSQSACFAMHSTLWFLGDEAKKYPPFRELETCDMGDDSSKDQKNKRWRLADLRSLMSVMEEVCLSHSQYEP